MKIQKKINIQKKMSKKRKVYQLSDEHVLGSCIQLGVVKFALKCRNVFFIGLDVIYFIFENELLIIYDCIVKLHC